MPEQPEIGTYSDGSFKGLAVGVPDTEFSVKFVQGMANRMSASYFKYGSIQANFPSARAVEQIKARLQKYLDTGNTEFLMDAANFAMIEYMHPHQPDAHFRATDSAETKEMSDPRGHQVNKIRDRLYSREGG